MHIGQLSTLNSRRINCEKMHFCARQLTSEMFHCTVQCCKKKKKRNGKKKQTSLLSILSQKHFPLAYLPWETRKRDPPSLCEKNEMQIDHNIPAVKKKHLFASVWYEIGVLWPNIKSADSAGPGRIGFEIGRVGNFLCNLQHDLRYLCSLLTYKNAQYLILKIWFIIVCLEL